MLRLNLQRLEDTAELGRALNLAASGPERG
jgi:hypothetical protein